MGQLAIFYRNTSTGSLMLWLDNGLESGVKNAVLSNGGEIRNLDSAIGSGFYSSMTHYRVNLVVSYYDSVNNVLKVVWVIKVQV